MMQKSLFLPLLITLIVTLTVVAFVMGYDWEYVEKEIGLTAKANASPLLAAKLLLKHKDRDVIEFNKDSIFLVDKKLTLPINSTLIIDEAVLTEHHFIEQAIYSWVSEGGHLVYVLSPRHEILDLENNMFVTDTGITINLADEPYQRHGFLQKTEANLELNTKSFALTMNLPFNYYFSDCEGVNFSEMKSKKTLICEQAIEQGFVTFLPSIHPISNTSLRHLDHGEFLLWLIGDNSTLYYLPSTTASSWLLLLWNWSWQLILLTTCSVAFIMWYLSMRLGKAHTPSQKDKNIFADHIEAVGHFMITNQHHQQVKEALLEDFEQVMENKNSRYKYLSIKDKALLISQLTGKNQKAIEQLLIEPLPEDESSRLDYIKLFKELRKLL